MENSFELRYTSSQIVARAVESDGAGMTISGYAATFNNMSYDLGGFKEIIAPGAFDDVLDNDVRAVFNHDPNMILGRSGKGVSTLRLVVDGTGLLYTIDLPNSSIGRDIYEAVSRGDIQESSFRFRIAPNGEKWTETGDGLIRTIVKISMLADVSPVTFPAYPDATVAARSLEQWKKTAQTVNNDVVEKIHLLNMVKLGINGK